MLEAVIAKVLPEQMQIPGACGEWSVKDILAHLDEWEQLHMGWMAAVERGETPEVPAPGVTWKREDIDRLNRKIYKAHCHEPVETVLASFRATHERFIAQAAAIPEVDLFTPGFAPFVGKGTLARWYQEFALHDGWGRNHIYQAFIRKPRKKE